MARKRGRPRVNAMARDIVALQAYQTARTKGVKHDIALLEAVEAVRAQFPKVAISASAVKRVVLGLQPETADEVFRVTKTDASTYVIGIGPRPKVRTNAKKRSR